jgi:putative ABC transport system permease protein
MQTTIQDLRYSLRMLRKSPGFAIVAILTLALGIGANTAIFSIVNSVLLRGLPFRDAGRLVVIHEIVPQLSDRYPVLPVNFNNFETWRKQCHSFEGMGMAGSVRMALTGAGDAQQLDGAIVTANFLDVLGVHPTIGRSFLPEEDQPGHDHVVILTDVMWRARFHSDPEIVGKTITLDGAPFEVAGVLPAWFHFPKGFELGPLAEFSPKIGFLKPLGLAESTEAIGEFNYAAIARLRAGVTREQALAELNVIQAQIIRDSKEPFDLRAEVVPLRTQIEGPARRGLLLLLGAVGAVLLIACVNLANLLLARLPARRREAAIRLALGASRGDLIRQMVTESCLLALIGGALGIALAYSSLGVLVHWAPVDLPRINEVRVDGWVLGFGLMLSLATGILCGALPAWRATLTDPHQELKSGSTRTTDSHHSLRLRQILTALEVGLSTALLLIAALLTISLTRVLRTETGFSVEHILAADVDLTTPEYSKPEQRERFYNAVLVSTQNLPGVTAAGWVNRLPLQGQTGVSTVSIIGDTRLLPEQPITNYRFVSPGYRDAMGIALIRGRAIAEADRGKDVAVISESLAKSLSPGGDPIGKKCTTSAGSHPTNEIIGIVRDIRGVQLDQPPVSMIYVPDWERAESAASLVVRTTADPAAIAGAVRNAIHNVDAGVPISELRPMRQIVSESVASRQFQMALVAAFSIGALILAALGIYGVVSQSVSQRLRELGIRRALGAQNGDVLRLILWQAMAPVGVGLIAGVLAALGAGSAFRAFLFGIGASDPRAILAVVGIVIATAALACQIPVRRALRADPMLALRYE